MTELSRQKSHQNIADWLDSHGTEVVRTHATNLDGVAIAKYLNRSKFEKTLPEGHSIGDMALAMDLSGTPHLTFWHEFRHALIGDIHIRPDLSTLVTDAKDPHLAHCIGEFTDVNGEEITLCPRTLLRRVVTDISDAGYTAKAAFELEFFLFNCSFQDARRRKYTNLDMVGASTASNIYLARNAYHAKPFMDEVRKRLDAQGIPWESWSDEGGVGQVELNFPPAEPVIAADKIVRARQVIYEVAVDLDMAVTFMAQTAPGYGNGLHIHHSVQHNDGSSAFVTGTDGDRTPLFLSWIAGILETMPGAMSVLCPTYNAYRRMSEFTAPPVTATWGEENKSAGLRVISRSPSLARIEHRLPSGDANPYLALAVILAGGFAGMKEQMQAPGELKDIGWGMPDDVPRLPMTMMKAVRAMESDTHLGNILGRDVIDYWINTRKLEWLSFHESGEDPDATNTTQWEFNRYFELI